MRKKRGMKDFYESNLSVQSEDLPTLSTAILTSRCNSFDLWSSQPSLTVQPSTTNTESEAIVPQIFFNFGDWEVANERILWQAKAGKNSCKNIFRIIHRLTWHITAKNRQF